MSATDSVIAVYDTPEKMVEAVKNLQVAGVNMESLSIAAEDTHTDEHMVGYHNADDYLKYWGKLGVFWGELWGLLSGAGLFASPGNGTILVAGPLVAWILAGLEGPASVGGMTAVGLGLMSVGVSRDSVLRYEVALKTDRFMLIVHGTPDAVAKAKSVIGGTEHKSYTVHGETIFVRKP